MSTWSLLLALILGAAAAPPADRPTGPERLVGTWMVDLRPTPDAPAYLQPLVIASADSSGVTGTFYGSPLTDAQLNTAWDGVHLAFETRDGSSRYVTTARLLDGVLSGATYSPDRGLLQPWRARRSD